MTSLSPTPPLLNALTELFYSDLAQLGVFEEVTADQLARDYRMLLAHRDHMTVTMERFYNEPVKLEVLEGRSSAPFYGRKILLRRESDNVVVQFGIVRINFDYVTDEVRQQIESRSIPLGRILINHNVLRDVHLGTLWRIEPGPVLRQHFGLTTSVITYGRTALIECDGQPAIELLEIAAPLAEVPEGPGAQATRD
jgi:chorismate-pyruvate lyase